MGNVKQNSPIERRWVEESALKVKWAEVLGDSVITTPILDSLVQHSEIFN